MDGRTGQTALVGRVVIRLAIARRRSYRLAVDTGAVGALRTLAVRWAAEE